MFQKEIKLWLDDVREAPEGWVWAKNARDALWIVTDPNVCVTEMSLDHDLGDDSHGTGYDFLNRIADLTMLAGIHGESSDDGLTFGKISIHSANPVGRANMEALIEGYNAYKAED